MISKRYTPIYYKIINKLWKTAKPYLERLDSSKRFDDNILEEMCADAERFAKENFKDLVKGDPVLESKINAACYELLNAISISAQREGLVPDLVQDEPDNVSILDLEREND